MYRLRGDLEHDSQSSLTIHEKIRASIVVLSSTCRWTSTQSPPELADDKRREIESAQDA
jgi:hypothetical protein